MTLHAFLRLAERKLIKLGHGKQGLIFFFFFFSNDHLVISSDVIIKTGYFTCFLLILFLSDGVAGISNLMQECGQ